MRKILFFMTLIVGILVSQLSMSNTVLAANANQKVAVVIISEDNDFRSQRFTDMAKEIFEKDNKNNKNLKILTGSEPQNKYKKYWVDKNIDTLEEPMPTRTNLIEFVSYGDYDKVIYLIVKNTDVNTTGYGGIYAGTVTRVSVTVNAYLVDRNTIINTSAFTREDAAHVHISSMKFFAFKKCVKDISKEFSSSL